MPQPLLPARALLRYALAATGGIIGYTPLLSLLLPIKLQAFAPDERYRLLVACSVAGALAAGVANIVFGWLGDRAVARGGGRRGWMVAGLIATAAAFAAIAAATRGATIVAAIVAFQIAVNALLAQVSALTAEEVPAAQKNTAAGLLTLGPPLAAAATTLVVMLTAREGVRLAYVAALMVVCVVPLLATPPRAHVAEALPPAEPQHATRALAIAWTTRLLVQVANSGVGLCLFFFFARAVSGAGDAPAIVARLLLVATIVPVPLALLLGRRSDRTGQRERFLAGAALVASAGLIAMVMLRDWHWAAVGYVAFASAVSVFQALNIGHAMLLLPRGAGPGRNLGLLNLANTLPQVVAPLLALFANANDFSAVLLLFATLTLAAALLPVAFRTPRTVPSYRG